MFLAFRLLSAVPDWDQDGCDGGHVVGNNAKQGYELKRQDTKRLYLEIGHFLSRALLGVHTSDVLR